MSNTDDEFNQECEVAAHRATRIHEWLEPLLRTSPAATGVHSFKGRCKKWDEIRKKVVARRNDTKRPQRDYKVSDVTDASGFRLVNLFNAQVPESLDLLLALLKTNLPPGPAKGSVKQVKEIEFHTSRRLDDPLSIYAAVKSAVEKYGYTLESSKAASSYSSVHVVLECQADGVTACCEIQLRSVFEEAWGEISHNLRYAQEKAALALGDSAIKDPIPKEYWLHLDALKSLTDGCAQYADLINRHIQKVRAGPANRGVQTTPLDSNDRSAAVFSGYGEKLHNRVIAAYGLRSKAVAADSPDARGSGFLKAAQAFQEVVDSFPKVETDEARRHLDVLREEIAYCGMFSGNADLKARAEITYRELCQTRPERVSVWLRLGQLRRDAEDYVEAKTLMEEGLRVCKKNTDPDQDVQRQANWLLRRDLAYVCWRLFDLNPGRPDAASLLADAITYSEESLAYVRTKMQGQNTWLNLLYYLVAQFELPGGQNDRSVKRAKEVLEELRRVPLGSRSVEELDTIARAEMAVGDLGLAKLAARPIVQKLGERIAEIKRERNFSYTRAFDSLSHDERDMFLKAQQILAHEGPSEKGKPAKN